jgi:FlaA1/EpsC-like NDP-sugar epimerase
VLAYAFYFRVLLPGKDPYPAEPITQIPAYSTLVPFVVLINFLAILGTGLYQRVPRASYRRLLKRTAGSAAAALVLLITFTFACKEIFEPHLKGYSRGVFGLFGLFNFAGLLAIRSTVRTIEAALHRRGLVADRLILIGNPAECEQFAAPLLDRLDQGQMPVGRIRRAGDADPPGALLRNVGTLADLRKIVAARKIDEIVIVDRDFPTDDLWSILRVCAEFNVRLSFLPSIPRAVEGSYRIREVGPWRVLSVNTRDLGGRPDERQDGPA